MERLVSFLLAYSCLKSVYIMVNSCSQSFDHNISFIVLFTINRLIITTINVIVSVTSNFVHLSNIS